MLFGFGRPAGAVYIPEVLIVPVAALPPATPFTSQFTVLFAFPVIVAVKACVEPARTFAVAGAIIMETFAGRGAGACAPVDAVLTHPAVHDAINKNRKQMCIRRKRFSPVRHAILQTQLPMMMRLGADSEHCAEVQIRDSGNEF
jgi:hypothetical protein